MNDFSTILDSPVELLKQFFKLSKAKDPEEDLQAAQIDARRLLLAAEQCFASQTGFDYHPAKVAAVKLLIAQNCIDSNEFDEGEVHLDTALALLSSDDKYDQDAWGIQFECNILQGIVKNKRCKVEQSVYFLDKAKASFLAMECGLINSNPPFTPEGLLIGTAEEMELANRTRYFQQLYTHCLYYLAQVHLQLGHKEEAAYYCQKTLSRQLDDNKNFDPHDWAINCASLSQVFLEESKYEASVHYLSCALSVEDKIRESKAEEYPEFHAYMHRCIATLGLNLFEKYVETFVKESQNSRSIELVNEVPHVNDQPCDYIKQTSGLQKIGLDVEKLENSLQNHPPTNYEQARDVFLFTQRSLLEARDTYYKIETHCNEFVEITQCYSKLFKLMASIEPDASRRIAMHRRRIDMLNSLVERLNPQFYLLRYRQLVYELAETYVKMVDIELAVVEHKKSKSMTVSKHEEKVNFWADAGVMAFERYFDTLRQPMNDKTKPLVDPLPEADVRPTLCAHLSMGSLYSKKVAHETPERISNLLKAQKCYQFIKAYCDRYPEAISNCEAEYNASAEMLNLMLVKLEAVRSGELK